MVQKAFPEQPHKAGAAAVEAAPGNDAYGISGRLIKVLDGLKERFSKLPLIQQILTELSDYEFILCCINMDILTTQSIKLM